MKSHSATATEMRVVNGVQIMPPEKVYVKPIREEESATDGVNENHGTHDDEMENDENAGMETTDG
jgi:hypothetical protein